MGGIPETVRERRGPPAVSELVTAGFWRRVSAHLLDCMVGACAWLLCSMWLVIGLWALDTAPGDLFDLALILLALQGLALALHIAYHVVLIGGCGQTLGKMALGVTVVKHDGGGLPGYGRAALRCLGGFLSLASLGIGYLGIVFTQERRGLADWLAGTRVVESLTVEVATAPPREVRLLGV
jgi:uncharacterized RDD family membrane protein YckC